MAEFSDARYRLFRTAAVIVSDGHQPCNRECWSSRHRSAAHAIRMPAHHRDAVGLGLCRPRHDGSGTKPVQVRRPSRRGELPVDALCRRCADRVGAHGDVGADTFARARKIRRHSRPIPGAAAVGRSRITAKQPIGLRRSQGASCRSARATVANDHFRPAARARRRRCTRLPAAVTTPTTMPTRHCRCGIVQSACGVGGVLQFAGADRARQSKPA
jgi:hypothetical protein